MNDSKGAVRIAGMSDLKEGVPFCATFDGKPLAVFLVDKKVYAIDNACKHAGGPLCEGSVEEGVVTCPLHGSKYKIETGAVVQGPAQTGVMSYPVEVRGDDVYVSAGT